VEFIRNILVIPDIDIRGAALLIVKRYSGDATAQAAVRADELFAEGDVDGCATWIRFQPAIEQLLAERPEDQSVNLASADSMRRPYIAISAPGVRVGRAAGRRGTAEIGAVGPAQVPPGRLAFSSLRISRMSFVCSSIRGFMPKIAKGRQNQRMARITKNMKITNPSPPPIIDPTSFGI